MSARRNSSSGLVALVELARLAGLEESKRRSITQKTRKASRPMMRKDKATSSGVESVKCLAIGAEILRAAAVPSRAIANWMPIAKASSWPVNQRTIAFETVMPVIS